MAESYLITIKFNPASDSVKATEKKLNSVFDKVTRRFKNGLSKVAKGFSIAGAVGMLGTALSALLNPLAELNDKINNTLSKARDIKQNAAAYGTSVQELAAIQGYARGAGISDEALNTALSRMQVLIGQAAAGEDNVLSNYKDETNIVKVFYNVMNQLSQMENPTERAKMAADIFGTRGITQLNPLISSGFDQKQFNEFLKGVNLSQYAGAVDKLSGMENLQSQLAFQRDIADVITKANTITESTIRAQDKNEKTRLELENSQIKTYETAAAIDNTLQELKLLISNMSVITSKMLPLVNKSAEGIELIGQVATDIKNDPTSHVQTIGKFFTKAFASMQYTAGAIKPYAGKGGK